MTGPTTFERGALTVRSGFASERGPRRSNEDYGGIFVGSARQRASHGIVAAVADGVGGFKGGRVAAELTVRSFVESYYAQPETLGIELASERSIQPINRWIHAQGRNDPGLEHAATTFTALVLHGRNAHVLHVGDSRAYHLRDGQLTLLTEDHTRKQPHLAHVLYRAIGIEETVRIDHALQIIRPYDRFLLCTDGVHGALGRRELARLMNRRAEPEEQASAIVAAALSAGSGDNCTAVVVDVVTVPPTDHAELGLAIAALPIRSLPATGDEIDGFRLGECLSKGRYNALFQAVDLRTGRPVVLKFPRPDMAGKPSLRLAFVREAWVGARLRSPFVGEVFELPPERQTCLYAAMPFYEGETLETRLQRGGVSLEEGVEVGMKLAKALATLHRAGVIHRDVKPENVILQEDGGLKLIDLSVARLPRIEQRTEEEIPGTPSFMAPELLAGEPGDERSDQFALGATLFRLFTRAYPYGEIEPFSRPRYERTAPLERYRPDLPAWLEGTLSRALAPDPAARFGDVIEMALELEEGLSRGAPQRVRRRSFSLGHRRAVHLWQGVSLLLALALAAALAA